MCDYSLMHAKSRPAAVGDKLITGTVNRSGYGTQGLFSQDDEACETAVCLLPGTELAFEDGNVGIFRQINKENPHTHHDVFEFAAGGSCLVHNMAKDTRLTVLQLPAAPRTKAEADEQERAPVTA